MCGIAGVVNFDGSSGILKRMTDSIAHRGPDGDGHWVNPSKNVGFGHRRLAIIDLSSNADQPMHYLNGRYTIVFNGEIYNYIEIKETLLNKGYTFTTTSDTEVLLALFDLKKEQCLQDLDGMFAFAVWDEKEKSLFCARDRFGEKPFYYSIFKNSFFFASEMKALWSAGVPRETNQKMLFNYLLNGTLENPKDLGETFFKSIRKLKASHYFYLTSENIQPKEIRYWDIDYLNKNASITEEAAAEKFRQLFFESVNRRLRSDVAVGSSLSGGLDSSAVVCTINQLRKGNKNPQATFSARFPGFAKDEGKFMEVVINRTNVEPHFVFPDEQGLIADFENLCIHQEEPFGSASIYAQYCVMRLAKENNVTVLLDGQGADEVLAGYPIYFDSYFNQLKHSNKRLYKLEKSAFEMIHNIAPKSFVQSGRERVAYLLPTSLQSKLRKLKKNYNINRQPFLAEDFHYSNSREDFNLNHSYPKNLSEALYQSTFKIGLETLLRYADRNSMAHSREVRLPFLSHHLVEFIFSLPDNFKINQGITKYIMRKAFDRVLPTEILQRTDKIGYEPPQSQWLKSKSISEKIESAYENLNKAGILHKNFSMRDQAATWRILMSDILL